MINWLEVRNFVIVGHVSLNFGEGMTVLTGETGAGKSIIVDALAVLLGDRVSGEIIRQDADRAEIQAGFDLSANPRAMAWLDEQLLNVETGECTLRRLVFHDRPSRGFINGRPVPIHSLRELGDLLVDIHGQQEHHLLLRHEVQRALLDSYAEITSVVDLISKAYIRLNDAVQALEKLESAAESALEQEVYLQHQVKELTLLDPDPDEFTNLEKTHGRLAHTHELAKGNWQSIQELDELEDSAASTQLNRAIQRLTTLSQYDVRLGEASTQLQSITTQLTEVVTDLRHWQTEYELDPDEYERVQQRLEDLHDAARKYRVQPSELRSLLNRFTKELETTSSGSKQIVQLRLDICELEKTYDRLSEKISKARVVACKALATSVTQHLAELGLEQAIFKVELLPLADKHRSRHGSETVAFFATTNPDLEPGPLEKIASGGELSRISLAVQVVTSQAGGVPSSIYDEVDVGIGGRIADIVGTKLKALGAHKQVLCITHLPQVAVQGTNHLQVSKQNSNGTEIRVESLNKDRRLEEITRMLGGIEITEETRAHAADMLKRATN